ncbi:MAG TPA: efflux RND transporter permease subunit, partial [Bacteroidales bacterium]|nr:efflux RND transporter permease subunit [Bacteroidales bacterium]
MIEASVKRRITTSMVYLGVILLGFISLSKLPVQLLPNIEFPKLTIVTPYEGAAPAEVEKLATKYIEEAVSSVNGVTSVYSETLEGLSLVTAQFEWGTNMDYALIETKEKVDIIKGQLPQDAGKSIVVKYDPKADPIMIYAIVNKTGNFKDIRRRIEKEVLPFLERIDGVALADISGGDKRQINVSLDAAK